MCVGHGARRHRDLASFDFEVLPVNRKLVAQLATCEFTAEAHNVVLVGGPGAGNTHLTTAIGVAGIGTHGKRGRFCNTVDPDSALEREKAEGKAGRVAASLPRLNLVILDELCYMSFSQSRTHPKRQLIALIAIQNPETPMEVFLRIRTSPTPMNPVTASHVLPTKIRQARQL